MRAKHPSEAADKIRSLMEHPGWEIFSKELMDARMLCVNKALGEGSEYHRVMYLAFTRAQAIPYWIIADTIEDPEKRAELFPKEEFMLEDIARSHEEWRSFTNSQFKND